MIDRAYAVFTSPVPGRPKPGEITSGDRLRYRAAEGRTLRQQGEDND
jgi:hypothetical protein